MTDWISTLMKTAEVEKQLDVCMRCLKEDVCEYCNKKSLGEYILPDFTAEKQLEIIKLISQTSMFYLRYMEEKYACFTFAKVSDCKCDFTQALAQLTTELMKAGELDKSKVKEILEG